MNNHDKPSSEAAHNIELRDSTRAFNQSRSNHDEDTVHGSSEKLSSSHKRLLGLTAAVAAVGIGFVGVNGPENSERIAPSTTEICGDPYVVGSDSNTAVFEATRNSAESLTLNNASGLPSDYLGYNSIINAAESIEESPDTGDTLRACLDISEDGSYDSLRVKHED